MNMDQFEGKWRQLKARVQQKWAKLTNDDLEYIAGSREKFVGRLQERYGIAREEAHRQAEEWMRAQQEPERVRTGGGSL